MTPAKQNLAELSLADKGIDNRGELGVQAFTRFTWMNMMSLRTILLGVVAFPLLFAAPAVAASSPDREAMPIQLAQAGDPRIQQLEEQIRRLQGLVEELNFQVLQMQDQMNRMQEDNEFRFQELEGGGSAGGGDSSGSLQPQPDTQGSLPEQGSQSAGDYAGIEGAGDGGLVQGTPPREFGTIVFDAQGNMSGATMNEDAASAAPADGAASQTDQTTVAALPQADTADELYRNSYEFVLSGDYATAEAGFRDLLDRFPGSNFESDAHFWLGEALLAQEKPREAAEVFLAASREYPEASKAPEMLLKLGTSLAQLGQRDVACATFDEVGSRYPNASDALKQRVTQERSQASC